MSTVYKAGAYRLIISDGRYQVQERSGKWINLSIRPTLRDTGITIVDRLAGTRDTHIAPCVWRAYYLKHAPLGQTLAAAGEN